jgi:predicted ATPase
MLLGIRIKNSTLFLDDSAGALLEDYFSGNVRNGQSMAAGISPVIPLSNLNAIIGRNQSGKSSFFDCLSFISDCVTKGCAEASVIRGRPGFSRLLSAGADRMEFELMFLLSNGNNPTLPKEYYLSYCFSLIPDHNGKPSYDSEKVRFGINPGKEDNYTTVLDIQKGKGKVMFGDMVIDASILELGHSALRSYGNILQCAVLNALQKEITHWFFCRFSNSKGNNGMKQQIAPGGHKHLNSDGSNVSNVLQYLENEDPHHFHRLMERIGEKIPAVGKVKDKLPDDFRDSPNRLFLYLLLLNDPMPRPLICIETPDLELYHDMVDVLSSEFRDFTIRQPYSQIIFSTHNPYILEAMSPEEVWIFKRAEDDVVDSVDIRCVGADPIVVEMYRQGVGMGAIWYSGHFDD